MSLTENCQSRDPRTRKRFHQHHPGPYSSSRPPRTELPYMEEGLESIMTPQEVHSSLGASACPLLPGGEGPYSAWVGSRPAHPWIVGWAHSVLTVLTIRHSLWGALSYIQQSCRKSSSLQKNTSASSLCLG